MQSLKVLFLILIGVFYGYAYSQEKTSTILRTKTHEYKVNHDTEKKTVREVSLTVDANNEIEFHEWSNLIQGRENVLNLSKNKNKNPSYNLDSAWVKSNLNLKLSNLPVGQKIKIKYWNRDGVLVREFDHLGADISLNLANKNVDKITFSLVNNTDSRLQIGYKTFIEHIVTLPGVRSLQHKSKTTYCEPETQVEESISEFSKFFTEMSKAYGGEHQEVLIEKAGVDEIEEDKDVEKIKKVKKQKDKEIPEKFQTLDVEFVGMQSTYLDVNKANQQISKFADYLKSNPDLKIKIIGVTNTNINPVTYILGEIGGQRIPYSNTIRLSKARAEAIQKSLIANGVPPSQIVKTSGSFPGIRLRWYTYLIPVRNYLGIDIKENRRIDIKKVKD